MVEDTTKLIHVQKISIYYFVYWLPLLIIQLAGISLVAFFVILLAGIELEEELTPLAWFLIIFSYLGYEIKNLLLVISLGEWWICVFPLFQSLGLRFYEIEQWVD